MIAQRAATQTLQYIYAAAWSGEPSILFSWGSPASEQISECAILLKFTEKRLQGKQIKSYRRHIAYRNLPYPRQIS